MKIKKNKMLVIGIISLLLIGGFLEFINFNPILSAADASNDLIGDIVINAPPNDKKSFIIKNAVNNIDNNQMTPKVNILARTEETKQDFPAVQSPLNIKDVTVSILPSNDSSNFVIESSYLTQETEQLEQTSIPLNNYISRGNTRSHNYVSESTNSSQNENITWKPIQPPEGETIPVDDPTATEIYNVATEEVIIIRGMNTSQQQAEFYEDISDITPPYIGLAPSNYSTRSVYPPDDRTKTGTSSFPWRTICKLYITTADNNYYIGSGAIVDQNHVLTAGHCVYIHGHGGWAKSIKVIPGMDNGAEPYGYAWATSFRSYSGWTSGPNHQHDWGLITLGSNIGDSTGWMGRMTASSSSSIYTSTLNTAGYPGDLDSGLNMYFDADSGRTADQYNHWYYMDTAGGQSGSPVWRFASGNRYILTIHAYGNDGSNSNHGTRLNQDKYDKLDNWLNEDAPSSEQADLVDRGQSYSGFTPTTVTTGTSFNVWCDIKNNGIYSSGGFYVSYYASTNNIISTSDYLIGTEYVSTISQSNYRDSQWSGLFPSIPEGTYYIGWIIDSGSDVTELDESNNKAYKDSYQLLLDDDTTGPSLSSPSSTGNIYDSYSGSYRIQISASDPSNIYTVKFRYKFGSSSWSSWYTYSGSSGSTYWYDILRSTWMNYIGQTVYFEIYAEDYDNDRTNDRAYTYSSTYTGGTISDDDTIAPTYSNQQTSPSGTMYDSSTSNIRLQTDWTDSNGFYEIKFRYKYGSGSWTGWQTKSGSSGNTNWYDIPKSEWVNYLDETLYWESYATDNDYDGWSGDRLTTYSPTFTGPSIYDDDTTPPAYSYQQTIPSGIIYDMYMGNIQLKINWTDSNGFYDLKFRYRFDLESWSGWLSPTSNSGITYIYNIPRNLWINNLGKTIYWESYAIDNDYDGWPGDRLTTYSSPTFTGPTLLDDDENAPSISNSSKDGNVDDTNTTPYCFSVTANDASGWNLDIEYYYSNLPSIIYQLSNFTTNTGSIALKCFILRNQWINNIGETIYWRYNCTDRDSDTSNDFAATGWSNWTLAGIIIDDDNIPPDYSNPTTSPAGDINDSYIGSIRLQIDWVDSSDIFEVKFRYKGGSGEWSNWLTATGSFGNTFYYDIPKNKWFPLSGKTIYWESFAKDNDNDGWVGDRLENNTSSYQGPTIIDVTPPVITNPQTSPSIFSPDISTTELSASISEYVNWTITIKNSNNVIIKMFNGTGALISQIWDGKNESGIIVPEGTYTIYFNATDKADHYADEIITTVIIDHTAPTGSIVINNNEVYTTSSSVTLTIIGIDNNGVIQMKISTSSDFKDVKWETFSTSKEWIINLGDGYKTVYIKFKDKANLISKVYSDNIILDKTLPTGSILINKDENYTTSIDVNLEIYGMDLNGISEMMISNDPAFKDADWEPYNTTKSWILEISDGLNVIYIKFKDNAGLISKVYSDSIILDTKTPSASLSIENGKQYINTISVVLNIDAIDDTSGLWQICFSNNGIDWTEWEGFLNSKSWNLIEGDGLKIVYVRIKDKAGLISEINNTIILDTNPVIINYFIINNGEQYTNSTDVILLISAYDETSEIVRICYSNDGSSWCSWETYSSLKNWELLKGDGNKTIWIKIMDSAGNIATRISETIILDTTPPQIISNIPSVGDMDVPLDIIIIITFNESINNSTITLENITVVDEYGNLVPGTICYNNQTVTFKPSNILGYNNKYFITVKTSIKDLAGNGLSEVYSWSFITLKKQEKEKDTDDDDIPDSDGDNIPDTEDEDDDNDNIPDDWEEKYGFDPKDPSDALIDVDNDKLTNLEEFEIGTNPTKSDSDGDGFDDKIEIDKNTDPNDPTSFPKKLKPSPDGIFGVGRIFDILLFLIIIVILSLLMGLIIKKRRKTGIVVEPLEEEFEIKKPKRKVRTLKKKANKYWEDWDEFINIKEKGKKKEESIDDLEDWDKIIPEDEEEVEWEEDEEIIEDWDKIVPEDEEEVEWEAEEEVEWH